MLDQTWRKSSRSSTQGACVEVRQVDNRIEVRDSKNKTGPVLTFTRAEWLALLAEIKHSDAAL